MLKRGFRRDEQGVAIVEFALVAPLLILLYVAMAQLCQGLMAERRASHAAASIGDLVTRVSEVDAAEVQSLFSVGGAILAPFPTTTQLKLRVSSVSSDAQGKGTIVWSDSKNWSDRGTGSAITIPTVDIGAGPEKLIKPGKTGIVSEVEYVYETPFNDFFVEVMGLFGRTASDDGFKFEEMEWFQPRKGEVKYKT